MKIAEDMPSKDYIKKVVTECIGVGDLREVVVDGEEIMKSYKG